ncbi:MAG: type II toxin-antitoxin system VapB family antitoxin [Deltaproteobacteria bacterium]|nr:type II toxin-antitoxin system VapB family antitoxin [Deltaproteobacteria bacterium]
MRTTVQIDDALFAEAQRVTNAPTKRALFEAGLRALIDQAARRRAIPLAGSMPELEMPPRRVLLASEP